MRVAYEVRLRPRPEVVGIPISLNEASLVEVRIEGAAVSLRVDNLIVAEGNMVEANREEARRG